MPSARTLFGLVFVALTTGSCDALNIGPRTCTLVGCSSGLTVHLPSLPPGAYKVEILLPLSDATYTYECTGAGVCKQNIFFDAYTEPSAVVRVTTTQGVRTTNFNSITYSAARPNGDDCPPLCLNATVNVPLPP